jgi:hypothetical protein
MKLISVHGPGTHDRIVNSVRPLEVGQLHEIFIHHGNLHSPDICRVNILVLRGIWYES